MRMTFFFFAARVSGALSSGKRRLEARKEAGPTPGNSAKANIQPSRRWNTAIKPRMKKVTYMHCGLEKKLTEVSLVLPDWESQSS
jgi:hypothetical protein